MSTRTKAFFLALLALLLLFVATTLFLLQARETLLAQGRDQRGDVAALQTRLADEAGTLATRSVEVGAISATATAGAADQAMALAEANGKVESLTSTLAETENALAETENALAERETGLNAALAGVADIRALPPTIRVVQLTPGELLLPGEPFQFVIFASDAYGLSDVEVIVNGVVESSFTSELQNAFVNETSFATAEEGTYAITVSATDSDGFSAEVTAATIEVLDYEGRNAAIRRQIATNVAEVRGLTPLSPIELRSVSAPTLQAARTSALAAALELGAWTADPALLNSFDFNAPQLDVAAYDALSAGTLTSFFDAENGELLVEARPGVLDPDAQLAYVLSYARALTDQHFVARRPPAAPQSTDAIIALRAMVLGEAELIQALYLSGGYFSAAELAALTPASPTTVDGDDLIARTLAFPTTAGAAFVTAVYERGGWRAVNALYADPPVATGQILHPERYIAGNAPVAAPLAPLTATLDSSWTMVSEGVLGEFFIHNYLLQQLDVESATRAAAGWGGDRYALYRDAGADALLLVLNTVWDTVADADAFEAAIATYAERRLGTTAELEGDGAVCWVGDVTFCSAVSGSSVLVIRAPDLAAARLVAAALAPN